MLIRHIDIDAFEALLIERRMDMQELAEKTGLSYTFIKYLVAGQRNPSKASAERIARVLEVPEARFITEEWVLRRYRQARPADVA